jgi:hypothetical protein
VLGVSIIHFSFDNGYLPGPQRDDAKDKHTDNHGTSG